MIRVKIAPASPDGPVVEPVPVGQARPDFAGLPGEVAEIGGRWLVAMGDVARLQAD